MIEINNSASLVALFGHWPDFHDGEIHRFGIDTTDHRNPVIEIEFEIAEMSNEVDERGYYRDRQRARATIRFDNVGNLRLEGLYNQNSIGHLDMLPATAEDVDEVLGANDPRGPRRHRVEWSSNIGMAGSFICDGITVLNAESYTRLPNER